MRGQGCCDPADCWAHWWLEQERLWKLWKSSLFQAQKNTEEGHKTAKRSNYICNELLTWADVYDTANHDERRAILQQFIKEIRVRKDHEISITLNASFNQVEQLKAVSTYDGAEIF